MGFWPVVKKVIKDSDIVVEVLDSRMPELSRNLEIERMIDYHGKRLVRVFTKIDIISEERLSDLKKRFRGDYFVSGVKNKGLSKLKTGLIILAKKLGVEEPKIGFVGYPNAGKSAIINALAKRSRAKVSSVAGTTKGIQWIKAGKLLILDSPGVVPIEDSELKLGLLGSKNPEKLKNLDKVVFALIAELMKDPNSLKVNYDVEYQEGMDEYDVLIEIGRSMNYLLKGNKVDENRAARKILKDWQSGKLRF